MYLKLKDETVDINGLSIHIVRAIVQAMCLWSIHGMQKLVITSALDGVHQIGSLHYEGEAIDLRSRNLPNSLGIRDALQAVLGDDYDVVHEPDHIHIEYDPPQRRS